MGFMGSVTAIEATWDQLLKYVGVAAAIAVVIVVAFFIRLSLRRGLKPRVEPHVYAVIEKVVVYGVVALGVMASLSPLGIDLTGLLVAGGIAGIVIGLASQTVFSNLISGVFLYIDRPLQIGDPVSVGDVSGQVIDISILSTKIRSWDGYIVRVPNDKVFQSAIMNYGRAVARRVVYSIGISYGSDVGRAREAILKVMEGHPFVLKEPPPEVFVNEFADSAIVLTARCWTPSQVWFPTKAALLEVIKEELKKHGVEIPFPQLDLHVKEDVKVLVRG
ncbi:MAG: mechanosensitive ion channel protein MscS [Desulfurococcales archaeon ex4484_204]|nr:MAG: mechanosensitive ion channel protein MscS [Desulfurococcales archaeon ex4484_204]